MSLRCSHLRPSRVCEGASQWQLLHWALRAGELRDVVAWHGPHRHVRIVESIPWVSCALHIVRSRT